VSGAGTGRDALRADAVRVLTGWRAPDAEAAARRRRFLELLAASPGAVNRDHPGAHLTASTLVVDAAAERVLLCLHRRVGAWLQLGGHLEEGDASLRQAALREATEESGIAGLVIGADPIHLDVHAVTCAGGPSLHYDVRYAVLAPPGAVEAVSAESAALGWFAPDSLPTPLGDATDVLVAPALAWARTWVRTQT
jgi:8-oxo-dGTP pyrophosphatase MutT (NUDIX family)